MRSVDICCVQETRPTEKSVRKISGKDAEYKLFWTGNEMGIGGVGVFLAKIWVDENIDINRVSASRDYYYLSDLSLCPTMWGTNVVMVVNLGTRKGSFVQL